MKSNSATKIVVAEEEQYEDAKSPDKSWPVMAEEVPTQTANREVFIRAIVTGASGSILRYVTVQTSLYFKYNKTYFQDINVHHHHPSTELQTHI